MDIYSIQIEGLCYVYKITNEHASCYLANYEDEYVCHKHNDGCKNINMCKKIYEEESKIDSRGHLYTVPWANK